MIAIITNGRERANRAIKLTKRSKVRFIDEDKRKIVEDRIR